jgi:hypothetical protein
MKRKLILILSGGLIMSAVSNAQTRSEKLLAGPYFGLKPPGMTATIFAEGILTTDSIEHSAPAFSPEEGRAPLIFITLNS